MDLWGLSRSAYYREAFQTQTPPAKPSRDLIEKLNAVALTGPMGNQEYFKGLMKDVLGTQVPMVHEGFQGMTSTLDQMLSWIDATSTATPPTFQLSSAITTNLSQIDQLEQFYVAADTERTRLLAEIRTFIGGKVTEFKTIVGNVAVVYPTLTTTESTVNAYTTAGIAGMDEAALVTAWNNYTTAFGTLNTSVETALNAKINEYNKLFSKYTAFIGTESVRNVDGLAPSPATLDAYAPPTGSTPSIALADLKGTGLYPNVAAYFDTNGFLEQMRSRIASELADWEGEYFAYWNGLTAEVKAQYNYGSMRPSNIASMTQQQLISTMNDFLGVADEPTTTPVVSRVTQLATGTIQQQSLAAIRQFYVLAMEGMVTVKQLADLTGNATSFTVPGASVTAVNTIQVPAQTGITIASLYSGLGTSLSVVTSTLSETNQLEIAKAKLRYEAGYTELFAYIVEQFKARIQEYTTLAGMIVGLQTENGNLPTGLAFSITPVDAADTQALNTVDLGGLRALQYKYFIQHFPAMATAYRGVFTFLSNQNQTLHSKAQTLQITLELPTVTVPALPTIPVAASTTRILPELGPNYPPANYMSTVSNIYLFTAMVGTLTSALQAHLNYRNNVTQQILNKVSGSTTPYTASTEAVALRGSFVTARTGIRDAVWSAVAIFQTQVSNVASVYPVPPATLTDTEMEVDGYEVEVTKAQDVPALVDTWNKYTTANGTFVPAANAALAAAQSLYDRLYRTFNRFVILPSVTSIQEIQPLDESSKAPSVEILENNNYEGVGEYYNKSDNVSEAGTFYKVLHEVRESLDGWENNYFRMYDALPTDVKSKFDYADMEDFITKSAEELISVMNAFGGVGDVGSPVTSSVTTGQITRLVTGTLQQQALESIRAFYKLLLENLVLFTGNDAIPEANFTVDATSYTIAGQSILSQQQTTSITALRIEMILDMQTLNGKLNAPLNSSEQGSIADMKARYDKGSVELDKYIKDQYVVRVGEYNALRAFKDAFSGIDLTAPATPFNSANRFNLCITRFPAITEAFQAALQTIRAANDALQATAATKPALPTRAEMPSIPAPPISSTTDIVPDLVRNSADFSAFFGTYMGETVPRVQALRQRIVDLTVALRTELNYRNQLTAAILNYMVMGLEGHVGVSGTVKAVAESQWTSKSSVEDILTDYNRYNTALNDYVAEVKPKVEKSLTEYDGLYSEYKAFRQNALRITADGAPAPSRFLRNEPIIDNQIEDLTGFAAKPTEDTLGTLAGIALQNKLVDLGKKYGDNKKGNADLLPRLIQLTSTEVADYIANYAVRFASLGATTRTLALPPSTVLANDKAALEGAAVTAEQVRYKMAAYGDVSTGLTTRLLEAVDRDAVWDAMEEFNDIRMHSFSIASAKTNGDTGALFGSAFADIEAIMLEDIETVKVATDSTVINRLYNIYTQALSAFTAGVNTDLGLIQTAFKRLVADYKRFYETYGEFMTFVGKSWSPLTQVYALEGLVIGEYANANTDVAKADMSALLTFLQTNLNKFRDAAQSTSVFKDAPVLSNAAYLSPTLMSILGTVPASIGTQIEHLASYATVLSKMTSYMIDLKSQHRALIQSAITAFLQQYDRQLKEAMNEMGEGTSVPAELAASIVCDATNASVSIRCKDTTVSSSESVGPAGTAPMGTFGQGYPYIDSAAVDTDASTANLVQYEQKYTVLAGEIAALRTRLLGVKGYRPVVIQYVQNWYTIYANNKTIIDDFIKNHASDQSGVGFQADLTELRQYFVSVDRNNFSQQKAAFNLLNEEGLKSTFEPYFAGQAVGPGKSEITEGSKYRNLLTLFANATKGIIRAFLAEYNLQDTQTYINIRPDILETLYPQIKPAAVAGFTAADISKLNSSIPYDSTEPEGILQIYRKYIREDTGFIDVLKKAYAAGNASAIYRNAASAAIRFFGNEYDAFAPLLFMGSNSTEHAPTIVRRVADRARFIENGFITEALKANDDATLQQIEASFYAATPAASDKLSVDYSAKFTMASTVSINATTLALNVKQAIARRILKFKNDFHAGDNDALWSMGGATNFVGTYFDIGVIDSDIAEHLTAVNNATERQPLLAMIAKYTVTGDGLPGYETMLQTHLATLTALKASREAFGTTIVAYLNVMITFIGVGAIDVAYATSNADFIELSRLCEIDFSITPPVQYKPPFFTRDSSVLNAMVARFSSDGDAYAKLLGDIRDRIHAKIDMFLSNYASAGTAGVGSPSIFTDRYATENRLSSFAPSYQNIEVVRTQVATDKTAVTTAATNNQPASMLEIWGQYAGTTDAQGYIAFLQTVVGELRTGREQRLDVASVLSMFYTDYYHPLSTRGKLLDGYQTKNTMVGELLNNWLETAPNGNYQLRNSFFEKSRTELVALRSKYANVMPAVLPASTVQELPALNIKAPRSNAAVSNTDPGRPDYNTVAFIKDIRYQMFMVIKDTVDEYNKYCYLFVLPGIQLDADLRESRFTEIINTDVTALRTATVTQIVEMQEKYFDGLGKSLKTKIGDIAGPLFATSGLRDIICEAAQTYQNIYNQFYNNLFKDSPYNGPEYRAMMLDYTQETCPTITRENYASLALECFYNTSNPTASGIYTISDNAILTCVKRRFLNPAHSKYGHQTEEEEKAIPMCSSPNAYNRLLTACKVAMQKRIDDCLKFYNDNVSLITQEGSRNPHMDLINIQAFTTADKNGLNGLSGLALQTAIENLRFKYYVDTPNSTMGLFALVQSEINGGGALGTARQEFRAAIDAFKTLYDAYNAVLYNEVETRYEKVRRQPVVTKYAEITGAAQSSTSQWLYSDNGTIKQTQKFNAVQEISQIDAEKALFVTARTNLIQDIKTTLSNVFVAFNTRYEQNRQLFEEVATKGWMMPTSLTTAIQESEQVRIRNLVASGTEQDSQTVFHAFFVGQTLPGGTVQPYLNQLDNAIEGARKNKAQYRTRDSMIRLYDLYERYKTLGVTKPTQLTTAETFVTFVPGPPTTASYNPAMNNATPETLTGDAIGTGNAGIKGQMDAAYNPLLAAIRQPLRDFITSYKTLRNRFLVFYEENKGTYFTDPTFERMLTGRTDSNITDDANLARITNSATDAEMYPVFRQYLEPVAPATENASTILIGLVRGFFARDQGAISIFKTQYQSISSRITVESPQVFTTETETADIAAVGGPTTLASLTSMVTRYDERFDFVRISKSRLAAATAIKEYWEALAQYPEIAAAEKAKPEYAESLTYVNFEVQTPTTPFTALFIGKTASELDAIKTKYEEALRGFTGAMTKQFEDDVKEFYEVVWPNFYKAIVGNIDVNHIPFRTDMNALKQSIESTSVQATATRMLSSSTAYTVGSQQVPPRTMYSHMKQFMASAKLLFMTFQYKSCLAKDTSARSMQFTGQSGAFQQLFGNNTRGIFGQNPFEAFQPQVQQPQPQAQPQPQPQQPQPQSQQSQGTSRWSLF